jgi:hypothetical protein
MMAVAIDPEADYPFSLDVNYSTKQGGFYYLYDININININLTT